MRIYHTEDIFELRFTKQIESVYTEDKAQGFPFAFNLMRLYMFKSMTIAAIAAIALIGNVLAADLGGSARADESVLAGGEWPDGLSVGVSGALGATTIDPAIAPLGADHSGFAAHLGYDMRIDNSKIVVGVEGSYGYSDLDAGLISLESTQFTVGARVGYLFTEKTLGYVGAGYRWAAYDLGAGAAAPSIDVNGMVLKIGVEQQLTDNFSLFLEGEKFYGEVDMVAMGPVGINVDATAVRVGAKYRF